MLTRSLSYPELVAIGLGSVIGSGIFVLMGSIIGKAGVLTPLAFILAALPNIAGALESFQIRLGTPILTPDSKFK